ncbi:MAG: acetate--CoA ligase family protein [Candidatus Aenigmarchaeota archaeon]|nr:acetate--CoA ligase family protein [Candidatus Aenigmarchaeota archaeon]
MGKLSDKEAEALMKKWGIPVAMHYLAKSENEAADSAKKLGFPVVLKVSSEQVLHKTDIGAVQAGLHNPLDVIQAYRQIMKNVRKHYPKARIDGMMVQEMASGYETIVGAKQDPQFGPVLMFGLGGIFVEFLKDVTFRIVPIERRDAREMISEIRGYKILTGVRGMKPANLKALEDSLIKISDNLWKTKRIKELDINPLFVNENGVKAVDVRVIVG